jgi:hypothetical protein
MSALLHSYLFAWLFLLGISLGALANLMVHALTGGRWGEPIRPPLIAAARLMPGVALLFLPILVGAQRLYPWAEEPGSYLNLPFFAARSIAYLAIWTLLALAFLRADRATVDPASGGAARAQRIAAGGLIVYALTMTLAAVDWIASLTPHWYSSGFGLVVCTGQMLAAMAFAVAVAAKRTRRPTGDPGPGWGALPEEGLDAIRLRFNDLGNLLLMYVLTWAYLAYTQFLVIWSENLPHEIHWYVPRMQTGWAALGIFLIAFHFFLPLLILLSRAAKRSPAMLGAIATALLVAHLADVFWLVIPSVRPGGFALAWSDAAALVVPGAIWAWLWRRAFARGGAASPRTEALHG